MKHYLGCHPDQADSAIGKLVKWVESKGASDQQRHIELRLLHGSRNGQKTKKSHVRSFYDLTGSQNDLIFLQCSRSTLAARLKFL